MVQEMDYSAGLGTMGLLPAAIGVKAALPNEDVIL